jgi:prevent-host-death family protein
MNLERDIHSLTEFKRNTGDFLSQLRQTGAPVVLTVNGGAELVVQDARSYQRLHDLAERLETLQAVRGSRWMMCSTRWSSACPARARRDVSRRHPAEGGVSVTPFEGTTIPVGRAPVVTWV